MGKVSLSNKIVEEPLPQLLVFLLVIFYSKI